METSKINDELKKQSDQLSQAKEQLKQVMKEQQDKQEQNQFFQGWRSNKRHSRTKLHPNKQLTATNSQAPAQFSETASPRVQSLAQNSRNLLSKNAVSPITAGGMQSPKVSEPPASSFDNELKVSHTNSLLQLKLQSPAHPMPIKIPTASHKDISANINLTQLFNKP